MEYLYNSLDEVIRKADRLMRLSKKELDGLSEETIRVFLYSWMWRCATADWSRRYDYIIRNISTDTMSRCTCYNQRD